MCDMILLCCIVNSGKGSKVLKIAKHHEVNGGTVIMGKGTVKDKLLEFLDLNDSPKEIVMMVATAEIAYNAMEAISSEMAFHKPYHGVSFTISLNNLLGTRNCEYKPIGKEEETCMYNAIFIIVDKGLANDVIDVANEAGARGGTIINARGSGIHETEVLFAMPIEPEKELVLLVVENEKTEAITTAVQTNLHIDEPGKGIIFITSVGRTCGIKFQSQ